MSQVESSSVAMDMPTPTSTQHEEQMGDSTPASPKHSEPPTSPSHQSAPKNSSTELKDFLESRTGKDFIYNIDCK